MRRSLVYRLSEIHRVYWLLWLLRGVFRHGLAHLLVASARVFFFALDSRAVGMKDGLGLVFLR